MSKIRSNLIILVLIALILIELPLPFLFSNKFSFTEIVLWGSSLVALAGILFIIVNSAINREKKLNEFQDEYSSDVKSFDIKRMILIAIVACSVYYFAYNIFTKTNIIDNSVIIFLPNFLWVILMIGYIGSLWYKKKHDSF